ncbi:MAG: tetratricopeptide repeat protein [Sulfuricaulis sp.]
MLKQQAIDHLSANRISEAQCLLEQITASDTVDAETWFLLGAVYGLSGNPKEAERCSRQATNLNPGFLPAWQNLGRALNDQDQHYEEAITVFRHILKQQPHDMGALTGLAHALIQQGDLSEALAACKHAIELAPNNPDACTSMGNLLHRQGQFEQSLSWYQRALALNPTVIQTMINLSLSLKALGRYNEAADWIGRALAIAPGSAILHYALAINHLEQHRHDDAAKSLRDAFRLDPGYLEAGRQLAAVLRHQNKLAEAIEVYHRILAKHPDDISSRFYLSALQGVATDAKLPTELLRETYEQQAIADSFDQALIHRLEYRLPQRLGEVVRRVVGDVTNRLDVLDLGCGTGLYGTELRSVARTLSGVDLSSKMAEKARQKAVYDTLIVDDLVSFLEKCQQSYDLIVAMDVLVFFGDLGEIVKWCHTILRPHGILAFDVEKTDGAEPWHFHPYGHYAHTANYIRELATTLGFDEVHFEETQIRKEADEQQYGYLCLYRKP